MPFLELCLYLGWWEIHSVDTMELFFLILPLKEKEKKMDALSQIYLIHADSPHGRTASWEN